MKLRSSISLWSVPLSVFLVLAPQPRPVYAQVAAPAAMNQAITNTVVSWATTHGFNPADPRIGETLSAMGARAAAMAATAAASLGVAANAVSWGAVAAYSGIGAILGAVPTSLGANDGVQWTFNPDGSVVVTTAAGSSYHAVPKFPASVACPTTEAVTSGYKCTYDSGGIWPTYCWQDEKDPDGTVRLAVSQFPYTYTAPRSSTPITAYLDEIYASCPAVAGEKQSQPPPTPPSPPMSPVTAGGQVPAANDSDTLNPAIVAGVTNALWSKAAQEEGYAGLPYPVNAPVLPANAADVESGMGVGAPTVGGFAGPVSGGGSATGASGAYTLPGQATSAGAGTASPASVPAATNPGSGAEVNLGPDPGIGNPDLEATPTAQSILQPLLSILPGFKSFAVPAHSGTCPQPSFTVFDQSFTVSEHCTLFEKYRSAISGASLLAFAIAALFIVLTA